MLVWWPLGESPPLAGLGSMVAFVIFTRCVSAHRRRRARRELADFELNVIDESVQCCDDARIAVRGAARPLSPADPDAEVPAVLPSGRVWPLTEQELDDLDLYAPQSGSVFGLLNRTSSPAGARRLRDWLEAPCLEPAMIAARQAAVRELRDESIRRMSLMAGLAALRVHSVTLDELAAAIRRAAPSQTRAPMTALRAWGLVSGIVAAMCLASSAAGSHGGLAVVLLLLSVNGAIYARLRRSLENVLGPWRRLGNAVDAVHVAASRVASDTPDAESLKTLAKSCRAVVGNDVLPSLRRALWWADTGGFIHVLLNVLIFFDLHVASAVLRVAVPRRTQLLAALGALADLDALASLACVAFEQPRTCFPEPSTQPLIAIDDGAHPLIPPDAAVPNSVRLDRTRHVWVITGANMAGKSTFLRMIGLNCLLAQVGGAVFAKSMTISPLRLITDLRVRDSLRRGESYFLAEVRHLRRIVLPPADDAPVLGLVDEPFRGTNSVEQTAASVALVRHLIRADGLYLVATHDRQITELADGGAAANYHFREELGENGPTFDYILRPGPAATRNALKLLEREGYPPSMLTDAIACAEQDVTGSRADGNAKRDPSRGAPPA